MQNAAAIVYTGCTEIMQNNNPNALREVVFRPMISWVNSALEKAGIGDRCYVINEGEDAIKKYTGENPVFVREKESGHPVFSATEWLKEKEDKNILIVGAEAVFTNPDVLAAAYKRHVEQNEKLTIIASGGREALMKELSISAFWIKAEFLKELMENPDAEDKNGKMFLVSAMKVLSDAGLVAGTHVAGRKEINMRAEDAAGILNLNAAARTIIFKKLCEDGVEFMCLDGIIIEPTVKIGAGTKILPGTIIKGETEIGENCVIGPNSYIEDSKIGAGTEVNNTQIRSSVLEDDVKIGPWSQVRPGCTIRSGCKIGDFVEIKNSDVGARTAVAHLTYIGDADVGEAVNFGCGCCIANYDGQHKHRTKIGNHAFLGCNTNLVAPVELEDFAYTAAGTTVTKNVPEYALAVGRAKQENVEGWVKKHDAIKIK
ncbi:MAG: bifunctional UDP-N-acetylglucosamine diphosphorylase/glucosamine-1-phosphate N-acetyltransferase GlmU [Oscillospiraceae bacterium]|nr:bifunctional UDP-N-acetylglucosamine diphosphorylase/glucosamine-1-phosphate N-acetyltransferase GlmU [Oscillospiraceae bacterium]